MNVYSIVNPISFTMPVVNRVTRFAKAHKVAMGVFGGCFLVAAYCRLYPSLITPKKEPCSLDEKSAFLEEKIASLKEKHHLNLDNRDFILNDKYWMVTASEFVTRRKDLLEDLSALIKDKKINTLINESEQNIQPKNKLATRIQKALKAELPNVDNPLICKIYRLRLAGIIGLFLSICEPNL